MLSDEKNALEFFRDNVALFGKIIDKQNNLGKHIYDKGRHNYLCTNDSDFGQCNMFIGSTNGMTESLVKALGYDKKTNMNQLLFIVDYTETKDRIASLLIRPINDGGYSSGSKTPRGISGKAIIRRKRGLEGSKGLSGIQRRSPRSFQNDIGELFSKKSNGLN